MAGKIVSFFREFVLIFSIILTIIGLGIFSFGLSGMFFKDIPKNMIGLSKNTEGIFEWSLYFVIIGFIILAIGLWYLYTFFKNRKFILEEIETNKRSELLKRHGELKTTVKHMPKKYQQMLKEKEKELRIK